MSIPRRGRGDESGATIVEVMMVLMLFSIFAAAVQTSLSAFVRTTRVVEEKTSVIGDVRVAEEAVARDLRAANPIDDIAPESVSVYERKVSFSVFCSTPGVSQCGSDNLRRITYQVVDNRFEQVVGSSMRRLLGPNGQDAVPVDQRVGAVVNADTEPVFTYLDRNGQPFVTSSTGQAVTTRRIHDCTKSVQIHLKVISEPRDTTTPYNLVTTVELRNFNEVDGC